VVGFVLRHNGCPHRLRWVSIWSNFWQEQASSWSKPEENLGRSSSIHSVWNGICSLVYRLFAWWCEWWVGIILAAALILAAVFGDLAESLIKRDLGNKDMSTWLPGHGGMMDRLDSMLPASLMTYLVMVVFFG
jgi:hypothetical protein